MKFDLTFLTSVVMFIITMVPLFTVVLDHIHSKRLDKIRDMAHTITKALEESGLNGTAKKELGVSKLGKFVASIPFFNLKPDQLDDFIDAAVNDLRAAGVKQNVWVATPDVEKVTDTDTGA